MAMEPVFIGIDIAKDKVDVSVAEQQTAERHAAWRKRLPQEPEALWTFIHEVSDADGFSFWRIACR